jgi:hypothetical protein
MHVDQTRPRQQMENGEQSRGRRAGTLFLRSAIIVLSSIAALFALLAVFSFARGLGQLFLVSGRVLLCGLAVIELDGFDRQLGQTVWSLAGPLIWGAAGAMSMAAARRIRLRLDVVRQQHDPCPPVVYLRSFNVDRRLSRRPFAWGRVASFRTEEEQLVEALREAGPVVALGKPGERLPRLGARRVYVHDAEWREQVLSWLSRAALVVIHLPTNTTEGLAWEIDQSLRLVARHRVVFVVTKGVSSLQKLNQELGGRIDADLLASGSRRAPYGSDVAGILHFARDQAAFCLLVKPPFFQRPFSSPLIPVYRLALREVIARLNGWSRPLPTGFGDAFIAALWIAFAVAVAAAVADIRSADRVGHDLSVSASCQGAWLP